MTIKFVGNISVDSGQVMICDPCYIDDNWNKRNYDGKHLVRVVETGELLKAPTGVDGRVWSDEFRDGMDWNEAMEKGIIKEEPIEPTREFSYDGCCKATLGDMGFGELDVNMGTAFASRTWMGDGVYPVYARLDDQGGVEELIIKFKD